MIGCTNPNAANYNPAATEDDNSCIYLQKHNGVCYAFKDVVPASVKDESFTLSFSFTEMDWVFFHDYIPDFYFSSRNQLFSLKNRSVFIHHKGAPGKYYTADTKPFMIDLVFNSKDEILLNSVQWLTEVFNNQQELEFTTITHITIWNNQQCTGRIALADVFQDLEFEVRKTQALWSFNTFRDMVKQSGTKFLLDIFNNFAVDTSKLDMEKPWFDQDLLHDNWFIIRLEYDNTSGNQLIFHAADINADKSYR